MHNYNPSGFLFPIAKLATSSTTDVSDAVKRLCFMYSKSDDIQLASWPGQRCTSDSLARVDSSLQSTAKGRTVKQELVPDSGYASAEEDGEGCEEGDAEDILEAVQLIRDDPYERDYSIRWLTGFISRSSLWTSPAKSLSDEEREEREVLMEKAAAILSCYSGANETDGALTREFNFLLGPSATDDNICVVLNDLFAPEDHTSVGLQSWASSIHLARMMCLDPFNFGIISDEPQRILELGAGTGLLSITAAKIQHSTSILDIIATDYHPDVLINLQRNIDTNFPSAAHSPIDVQLLDWQFPSTERPFNEAFDVILAADVVYNPSHAGWIKYCVGRLLKRPTPACPGGGVFWMIIAVRNAGRHEGLAASVLEVFPEVSLPTECEGIVGESPYDLSLKTVMVQDVERGGGVGRVDESGYRLFRICWA
ncbi:hypothetical protein EW145_g552 [Phellinidium pouzarii]|uniref:Uncharacterized protein n=1 Tax=Phellinidium pouzarii TaxID=167371 RepID=A0A4S4LHW1_9AGAM|nr:hypothetical protein EW145_g552 [Phellinidium pouzarii]